MRFKTVILAIAAAALLYFAATSFSLFGHPAQPPTTQSPPGGAPAGTVAWSDPVYTFTHQAPIDPGSGGDGKGHWMIASEKVPLQKPGIYSQHTIIVWTSTLDAGATWNLNGNYEVLFTFAVKTLTCSSPYELSSCTPSGTMMSWQSGSIKFDGNQGARGSLFIDAPTVFFSAAGNYRAEFSSQMTFTSGTYSESDTQADGFNFNVPI
jgi:hypothetical protein